MPTVSSMETYLINMYIVYFCNRCTVVILQSLTAYSAVVSFKFCYSATVSLFKIDSSLQMYSVMPIHYNTLLFGHRAAGNDS